MAQRSENLCEILEEFQTECRNDRELQRVICNYLSTHDLALPENIKYSFGIDFYAILINDDPVLIIVQPPGANYKVYDTEHTFKYLKKIAKTA